MVETSSCSRTAGVWQIWAVLTLLSASALSASAQTPYQPKFPGDPARSDSEAAALGYMRTVLYAEKVYNKKNSHYTMTLAQLVGTHSFTRRMVNPDRGDYTVSFHGKKDGFQMTMTPKQLDAQHRSFYAEDDGAIHADEEKAATEDSPKIK